MISGPVLVTGASRGIGRALAAALAGRGARVLGTSRQAESLADRPAGVAFLSLRLEDPASVDACARAAGEIEILVNNAGQSLIASVEDASPEAVEEIFRVNLLGLIRLTRAVLPGMRERGRGMVVNLGSLTGTYPPPFQSAYAASKRGLEAFSASLRGEVAPFGVRVVHMIPGYIQTGIEPGMALNPGSPYEAELGTFRAARDAKMAHAVPTGAAVKKILRVLEKKNPRPVYYAGRLVPAMGLLRRFLSERAAQRLTRKFYKLP
ncbi:MAG: SDR family NAD(P)-dependent oxidoreductase [Candidatus Aminicenantes bacterium]|nr:SDR family NAD(P)-dependent oxidoreductase [Candidatus Aminicenantes bacterium]